MNTRAFIATARCAADYNALLYVLVHARARVFREYLQLHVHTCMASGLLRRHKKLLQYRSSFLQTAVSAMCAARSVHASALLNSVGHMSMLAKSLKRIPSLT